LQQVWSGDSLNSIIDTLHSVGIATVIASGNNGYKDAIGSPACIPSAVSVGATEDDDDVASFSNVAYFLDLFAPGVSITSSVPGGGIGTWNGTSMATPHVTGAWAVLKQAYPNATVDEVLTSFITTGPLVDDNRSGGIVQDIPRINVYQALGGASFIQFSSANYSVNEGDGSATITVTRSGNSVGEVSVVCSTTDGSATAPADYTSVSQTLTWLNGQSGSQDCEVPIIDDSDDESDETVNLQLSSPSGNAIIGAQDTAVLTIVDNDEAGTTVTVTATDANAAEPNNSGEFTVWRNGTAQSLTVTYNVAGTATGGNDYTALSGSVTIAANEASATITVDLLDDSLVEGDETVIVILTNSSNYTVGSPDSASVLIADDDFDSGNTIFVSSTSGGNAGGVNFKDEDILAYETDNGIWTMYFDGSDVGLSGSGARDVDAFHLLPNDDILFSVVSPTTLPDVGEVDDSDIVRFIPSSLGPNTGGTFELYFDGSDVGLSTNGEDIDAIHVLDNGDLIISTKGNYSVSGVSGGDEDLLRFSPTTPGDYTSGSWSLYLDGSQVGLNNSRYEDVNGVWIDEETGNVYLTTLGAFQVDGLSGSKADIFICEGLEDDGTGCTFSSYMEGSTYGFSGEVVDGLTIR